MSSAPSRLVVMATSGLLILIWGTTWAAIRFSLDGFPPFKGVAIRFGLAALFLFVVSSTKSLRSAGWPELRLWIVQAGLTYSLPYGLVYWAEQWVPSGLTAVIFSTFPLWVLLFAYPLIPSERVGVPGLIGIASAVVGMVLIFAADLQTDVLDAALLLLLAPLGSALAHVLVKRWGAQAANVSLTAVPMAMTGVFMGLVAAGVEADRPVTWGFVPTAALLYLTIAGTSVTFSLYFWLLKHVSAIHLSLIAFAIPVVALIVGAVVFGEPLTWRIGLGAAFVLVGVFFASRPQAPAAKG